MLRLYLLYTNKLNTYVYRYVFFFISRRITERLKAWGLSEAISRVLWSNHEHDTAIKVNLIVGYYTDFLKS